MPPSSLSRKRQAAFTRSQLQSGHPWPQKWNWLLDKPHKANVGQRWVAATAAVFNGMIGLLWLTPVYGTETETLNMILGGLGAALFLAGCAYVWSALRLHQFNNNPPA